MKDLHDYSLLSEVADYYSGKIEAHGMTPQGVDWNGKDSQYLRFEQLIKIVDETSGFSLNDLGCGYGALFEYLSANYKDFTYFGYDVSEKMVAVASEQYAAVPAAKFSVASMPMQCVDYGVASGIFNVSQERGDNEWYEYILNTLDSLDQTSNKGFAFNCLTLYSDEVKKKNYLYYADPCVLFDLCKKRYSRNVALLHDYGLYEFTVLVRKF